MDIDALFEGPLGGSRSWYDRSRPEVKQVLDQIVDAIIERGSEPNWAAVRRYLESLFPGEIPTSKAGVSDNVRRLVKARQ